MSPKGESLGAKHEGASASGRHAWVAAGVAVLGALTLAGAMQLPSQAGYTGVGPDFVPLLVGLMLLACGGLLLWEAATGGLRGMEQPSGSPHADWRPFAWVSAGILANAALITTVGFVIGCTLCYVLAVRGFRLAKGPLERATWLADTGIGVALTLPVYLLFTKLLAINLPGLTSTGWL